MKMHRLAYAAQAMTELPSPPFVYLHVDGFLFRGIEQVAILAGVFKGTPVGDFQELWEGRWSSSELVVDAILVDNELRERAGRLHWGLPKRRESISVDPATGCAWVDGALVTSLAFGPRVPGSAIESVQVRCDARRKAILTLPHGHWHDALLHHRGEFVRGTARRVSGKVVLGIPELAR